MVGARTDASVNRTGTITHVFFVLNGKAKDTNRRQRRQREEEEKYTYLRFMTLCSEADRHTPPERHGTLYAIPPSVSSIPLASRQLTNGHHLSEEWVKPWVEIMPIRDMFRVWGTSWEARACRQRDQSQRLGPLGRNTINT